MQPCAFLSMIIYQASLAAKRKENAKTLKKAPRTASTRHVVRCDRFCELYLPTGQGLDFFQNKCKLTELNLLEFCRTGKLPSGVDSSDKLAIPDDLVIESIVIVADQVQYQVTGGEFIFASKEMGGLDCTGVRIHDPFHRLWNDVGYASSKSGLRPAEEAASMIFNIGYGPWQSAAYYHMICSQGERCAQTLQPNGALVRRFWPRYLTDMNLQHETTDNVVGSAARVEFVKNIAKGKHLQMKLGGQTRPSSWFSIDKAGVEWDPLLAKRGIVISSLVMEKG